ncbi:PH domain-containing protein [Hoyosella sp. G463]|uniref:PH domain-containing protein n=1 Tax=Lolliginicoccus lacisalsi TaxID=2742202 RepID=A0A927PMD7_9ACTN|nr:PH domain-containing protein [Lolliginicoccus lacisalsi]MBD8506271.1 PH domain-containing protein [Lolliginicoccus lacisalsi]
MDVPTSKLADPAWRPSRKAPLLWASGIVILWLVLIVAQALLALARPGIGWPLAAAAVATVVLAPLHIIGVPWWRYRVHRWEITGEAVHTRQGWLVQEHRIAPISRVQTVDTTRGPIDRLLGLATVTVTTASSAGAVTIPALDLDVAERTVRELTDIAAQTRGDAT